MQLKCTSCGGLNQLPEGKDKMFCSFCGNPIEELKSSITPEEVTNNIKAKPLVNVIGELSLTSKNIKSIKEVTYWFSDTELKQVRHLNLSNNEIKDLDGLSMFENLVTLDLSNNQIFSLDNSGNEKLFSTLTNINFSGNRFENLDQKSIDIINSIELWRQLILPRIEYDFKNNQFSNYEWLNKIDFDKILNTVKNESREHAEIQILIDDQTITKCLPEGDSYNRNQDLRQQQFEKRQKRYSKKGSRAKNHNLTFIWVSIVFVLWVIMKLSKCS